MYICMDVWLDALSTSDWFSGWMDEERVGLMDGWIDRLTGESMYGLMIGGKDGYLIGWMDGYLIGWLASRLNVYVWVDYGMDVWLSGWMKKGRNVWINVRMDGVESKGMSLWLVCECNFFDGLFMKIIKLMTCKPTSVIKIQTERALPSWFLYIPYEPRVIMNPDTE